MRIFNFLSFAIPCAKSVSTHSSLRDRRDRLYPLSHCSQCCSATRKELHSLHFSQDQFAFHFASPIFSIPLHRIPPWLITSYALLFSRPYFLCQALPLSLSLSLPLSHSISLSSFPCFVLSSRLEYLTVSGAVSLNGEGPWAGRQARHSLRLNEDLLLLLLLLPEPSRAEHSSLPQEPFRWGSSLL